MEKYFEESKKLIDIESNLNIVKYLVESMNHKKDCLITYSANHRKEMENRLYNLEKKLDKFHNKRKVVNDEEE